MNRSNMIPKRLEAILTEHRMRPEWHDAIHQLVFYGVRPDADVRRYLNYTATGRALFNHIVIELSGEREQECPTTTDWQPTLRKAG